jgi:hypothetical protein
MRNGFVFASWECIIEMIVVFHAFVNHSSLFVQQLDSIMVFGKTVFLTIFVFRCIYLVFISDHCRYK